VNREAIFRYIDDHLDEHVAHIQGWVRQKSVSWDDLGVEDCAGLVADSYRRLGCREVEVIPGRFYPGVWAHYDCGAPATVHSYCMFDTRTVKEKEWTHDPWGAELVQKGPYPKVLVGRGAMGAKGPHVAWLNALEAIIAVEGKLPLNVMFLAEGEEILGSPTYAEFVQRYADRLKAISSSFVPAMSQSTGGTVTLGLGLKGMVVIELTASGDAWGRGPARTIHSSMAALVSSPPFRLAKALATLVDGNGEGCEVPELKRLWQHRKPLGSWEKQLLDEIARRAKGKDWRDALALGGAANVRHVHGGMNGMDPLVNSLYGPTFNVAGLRSGFLGPETGTIPFIVPARASATIDIRMVVDLSPEEIIDAIRRHLDRCGFSDIEIDVLAAFGHSQTPLDDPGVQSVVKTLEDWEADYEVWPIQGGGGPWTAVPNAFGVPCIRGGVIGGGASSPVDEYIVIEGDGKIAGLAEAEKFMVDMLFAYAGTLQPTVSQSK
jgi:acetylornithine deacetylase/succinyl-diaminopimelate desuccinylase-like protein